MTAAVAPGVRDRLLTRLDELLAFAEAATPGPWSYAKCGDVLAARWTVADVAQPWDTIRHDDGRHIAVHSPALMVRVWTALRDEVERHETVLAPPRFDTGREYMCGECTGLLDPDDADCPFVLRWADVLGVTT